MSGTIPSLHLYAFVARKGITLYSPLPECYQASSFPFFFFLHCHMFVNLIWTE